MASAGRQCDKTLLLDGCESGINTTTRPSIADLATIISAPAIEKPVCCDTTRKVVSGRDSGERQVAVHLLRRENAWLSCKLVKASGIRLYAGLSNARASPAVAAAKVGEA